MQNLTRILAYHARTRPDAEAIVFDDQRISYAELNDRALRAAGWLASGHGVGPGTIVAILMKNAPAYYDIVFALSHLGAVTLPLNYRLSRDEITYITGHAGADLIIVDEGLSSLAEELSIPKLHMSDAARRDIRHAAGQGRPPPPPQARGPADLFRPMYTSGTTDRPKGVTHTYGNLYWKNAEHVITLGLTASERLLVVGPLYHVGGFDLPGSAVFWVGGTIVLMEDFDAAGVLATIARERVTGAWLPPVMTNAILALPDASRYDVSTFRWCVAGGERTPEARIRTFVETFPNARYIDAYGMTETVSGDTFMEAGREIEKIGSTGRPTMHVDVEIRDDDGNRLAPHEEGEICMRGEKVTRGYWRDEERTKAAFWPGGWLRSGDVGYLDDEGFLYLTDRKKDMIISGGENIASSEVERVLYEMPEILEAAVVARPDEKWGETPVAVVVTRPGCTLDLARLQAHCRQHLGGFKIPRDLVLMEALPRNPSGKVLKRDLREQLLKS
jgi:fatty-acyl-CoA synthase